MTEKQIQDAFDAREAQAALLKTPHSAEYVRGWKDCEAKVRQALAGHPESKLWGEHGLIAATMRCVFAVQEMQIRPCCGRPEKDCDCEPTQHGKSW